MTKTERYFAQMEQGLFVFRPKDESPVFLSVPHDGLFFQEFSGFWDERKVGYMERDMRVWFIAKDILLSAKASAVRGLMPRVLIDYNRASPYSPLLLEEEGDVAFNDASLIQMYEHYHELIDRTLSTLVEKFGKEKVILFDLHGFSVQPFYAPEGGYDLILGTGNRKCIPHGNVDEQLALHLTELGYKVFLPKTTPTRPTGDAYNAGFITRHYSKKHGINAIQIEIASRFRARGSRELGQKLSRDLAEFIQNNYL